MAAIRPAACTPSTATQPSLPVARNITVNEHPQTSKASKKVFLTTMKKYTKKSSSEVNQSTSPSSPGGSESEGGLRSHVKSKLGTFFNKFSNKLSSKPPSRSTSPLPSTSTGNPAGETPIGKYSISSAGTRLITPSEIPQRLPLRMVRLKCHLRDQGLIARRQHRLDRRYQPLLERFKVSDLATHRPSSD